MAFLLYPLAEAAMLDPRMEAIGKSWENQQTSSGLV